MKMTVNIYIDSDVLVASEIPKEPNHKESKRFMEYVLKKKKSNNVKFFTSRFTLLEIASAIIRRTKNVDKAYSFIHRLTSTWKESISSLNPDEDRLLSITTGELSLIPSGGLSKQII